MSKHTPTPWKAVPQHNASSYGHLGIIIEGDTEHPISQAIGNVYVCDVIPVLKYSSNYEAEANAEFIVRAVNNHEQLLAACIKQKALMDQAGLVDSDLDAAIKSASSSI